MSVPVGLLRLTRPANVVTAAADILAGVAISGFFVGMPGMAAWRPVALLCLAGMCLYAGGVVLNDVCDAGLDATERPERPIPSGVVPLPWAAVWGVALQLAGIAAAWQVSAVPAGLLAMLIAVFSIVYDKWGKHHSLLGPLNMGLCRGLNLLLGISILPVGPGLYVGLCLVPVVYIGAITMVSRGEVHGGKPLTLYAALGLYSLVSACIAGFGAAKGHLPFTLLFLAGFTAMIVPPLLRAVQQPAGKNIGKAVKAGVIGLIVMDAAWAAAFGQPVIAVGIVALLPLSLWLARAFAVT